jgi:colanic acid biosynthesis glycosyl transferase WcaI
VKILMYGINFAPEVTGVGKYTAEMAAWLAQRGHTVRVVTAPPYYPNWKVFDGHQSWAYRTSEWHGVRVMRCPLWVPGAPTGLTRLLHLMSFAVSSLPVLVAQAFWRPSVLWVVEPPLFCAPAAALVGWACGAKTVMHVQDLEVDAAFELGLLRSQFLRRVVTGLESFVMKRFDVVSTISRKMVERVRDKGVSPRRLFLLGNWADTAGIVPGIDGQRFKDMLAIPRSAVVALYSGNMGRKQGLELLAEVARALVAETDVYFVFCGAGVGKAELQASCEGLKNVRFMDLQPVELLPQLLGMADIHLLPQRADASDLVMPSKLCGMLASGKAVVATALEGSELASVVSRCGLVVPPGDVTAAAAAVLQLARHPAHAQQLGRAGRAYSESHLDQTAILDRFVRCVTEGQALADSKLV